MKGSCWRPEVCWGAQVHPQNLRSCLLLPLSSSEPLVVPLSGVMWSALPLPQDVQTGICYWIAKYFNSHGCWVTLDVIVKWVGLRVNTGNPKFSSKPEVPQFYNLKSLGEDRGWFQGNLTDYSCSFTLNIFLFPVRYNRK